MQKFIFLLIVLACCVGAGQCQSALAGNQIVADSGRVIEPVPRVDDESARGGRGALTTLFAMNNAFAGNTFDILPAHDLSLTDLDINWTVAGEQVDVDVYYKNGTCVGFENVPTAWTLLASSSGVGAGTDLPTAVDLSGNGILFSAGTTYGIYVDVSNHGSLTGDLGYTNGGPSVYSNAALAITTNTGQSSPAFSGSFFPRQWNGTFYYELVNPLVDIKINGSDGPLNVLTTDLVSITVSVDPGTQAGVPHDWWLVTRKNSTWIYWFNTFSVWTIIPSVAHSGGLVTLNDFFVTSGTLPVATWEFAFAVDAPDFVWQGTYQDICVVTSS